MIKYLRSEKPNGLTCSFSCFKSLVYLTGCKIYHSEFFSTGVGVNTDIAKPTIQNIPRCKKYCSSVSQCLSCWSYSFIYQPIVAFYECLPARIDRKDCGLSAEWAVHETASKCLPGGDDGIWVDNDTLGTQKVPQKGRKRYTQFIFLPKNFGQTKTSWEKLQMWVFWRFWAPWIRIWT